MLQDSSTSVYRVEFSGCNHSPKHLHSERGICIAESAKVRKSSRRKEVFSTSEIPHLWAHNVQSCGRNPQNNLFWNDETIYSYRTSFPIARHVYRQSGKIRHAVLVTTDSYSVTTSGHISAVRQAIPPSVPVFNVPFVGSQDEHRRNLGSYQTRIRLAILASARARSTWRKESERDSAIALTKDARAYARFFDVPCPKLQTVPALDSEAMAKIRKSESAKAAKEAQATKRRAAEEIRAAQERVERWRNGEQVYGLPYSLPVMLRIITEETNAGSLQTVVETSKGARVPVSHAKRALSFVRKVVASGVAWHTNGHKIPVGVYQLDRIDADGTVVAGCHVIPYAEIERLAPQLLAIETELLASTDQTATV